MSIMVDGRLWATLWVYMSDKVLLYAQQDWYTNLARRARAEIYKGPAPVDDHRADIAHQYIMASRNLCS